MLNSTNVATLRNLVLLQVAINILKYLKDSEPEKLKLDAFVPRFEEKVKAYDDVLVYEKGNVLSEQVEEADHDRDSALRALIHIVTAYQLLFPDAARKEAVELLKRWLKKLEKDVTRLPYLQESGALHNLLEDLELEESKAAIALLHLEEWVEKLKKASTHFDDLFTQREMQNSVKVLAAVKDARQKLQEELNNLGVLIRAHELEDGPEAYVPLCQKINEALDAARLQAEMSASRRKKDEEKPKEEEPKEEEEKK